ncbi:transglutaminase-like domain-containing protein [Geomonas anaerohicana]|uniref:Transglutaminase domain-containing protein n=1 Tax=Geomonas anaerohicana TaxID=2798583 RepID=A0ABS0YDN3_9BACT|nr:transglutaminase domain-containing protein [Geomonas anaerohicana]MBJ6750421.1 transglutaminase domain-containing protein [Geomonas anaerohicana]
MWFPYPTSDLNQKIENLHFDGNYSTFTLSREPQSGALYLYTQWRGAQKNRHLTVTFDATAQERKVTKLVEQPAPIPPEVVKYVKAEFWIPSDEKKVKALSHQITAGKKGILKKARAVYDWVVDNTKRDPKVPGCGVGNVQATLAARSGKCADISTLFVALARAAGVPAREVFGLRLGRPGQTDISNGHHCWAEFYLPGTGWVPVDPADVTKAVLEKNLTPAMAKPYREYYFGAVDEFRIVLQKGGRGIAFSEGNKEKVNYFMYPYAEVDGKSLDYCRPDTFAYTVSFRER